METSSGGRPREPWNKGKLIGQKAPFKPKEVWGIREHLLMEHRARDLALFDLGIDSKLRACDLTALRVRDIQQGERVAPRAGSGISNSGEEASGDWDARAFSTKAEPRQKSAAFGALAASMRAGGGYRRFRQKPCFRLWCANATIRTSSDFT